MSDGPALDYCFVSVWASRPLVSNVRRSVWALAHLEWAQVCRCIVVIVVPKTLWWLAASPALLRTTSLITDNTWTESRTLTYLACRLFTGRFCLNINIVISILHGKQSCLHVAGSQSKSWQIKLEKLNGRYTRDKFVWVTKKQTCASHTHTQTI